MTNFDKLTRDIPEDLRNAEAIQSGRDDLAGDPKDNPMTSVATMAMALLQRGCPMACKEMETLNRELDGHFPYGDIVMVGALLAAAQGLALALVAQDPRCAGALGAMQGVATAVTPRVAAMLAKLLDGVSPGVIRSDNGIDIVLSQVPK